MDILFVFSFIGAIFIGISLGLIGGGGSIITVPVLVYLMDVNPVLATAYSLFIVGVASLVGSITYFQKGLVHVKTATIFGAPAIATVYVMRKFIVPAIPETLFEMGEFTLPKDIGIMVVFALAMIAASVSMINGKKQTTATDEIQKFNYPLLLLFGILVGSFTGLIGAGGGFLIIPALIALAKLPMKKAVGTSLLIISFNSLIGFLGDLSIREIHWTFLLSFTFVAVIGIFAGSWLSNKISGTKLKPAFGWFVLLLGIFILRKSLIN
ncbi:MAG: putative membrane protein YfcA [Salibacteraceae bacterium]|jgi:uncharacterized membrane protein YfcA